MRELTLNEITQVSGGAVAPLGEVAFAAGSGAIYGALAGSRLGLYGAIGGAVFFGAMGGTMVIVRHAFF